MSASTLDPRFTADSDRKGLSLAISEAVAPTGGSYYTSEFDFGVLTELESPGHSGSKSLSATRTSAPAGQYKSNTLDSTPFGIVIASEGFTETTTPIFVSALTRGGEKSAVATLWMPDGGQSVNGEPTYTPVHSARQVFEHQKHLDHPATYNLPVQLSTLIQPQADDQITRCTAEDGSWSVDLLVPTYSKRFRSRTGSAGFGLGLFMPGGTFGKQRLITLADCGDMGDAESRT